MLFEDVGHEPLTRAERAQIVRQALMLLQDNYVHLEEKKKAYAVDPTGRLEVLLKTLETGERQEQLSEDAFHREMLDIFFCLRDRHMVYMLPDYWEGRVAYLPFMVEQIQERGQRKYIVSKILRNAAGAAFRKGVEIVHWNGMPVERAVWNFAQRHAGGNLDARHAMGLMNLTLRALRYDPPPDEDWVVVTFRMNGRGRLRSATFHWTVDENPWPAREQLRDAAMDGKLADLRQTQGLLFAEPKRRRRGFTAIETRHPRVFRARRYTLPSGTYGYIRIWRFSDVDEERFIQEFVRLLKRAPRRGLIIDIRDNPGGKIEFAERILQTLTSRRIEPERFQFRNSPLNLQICEEAPPGEKLWRWTSSIRNGLRKGRLYSAAFPKTDPRACNSIGRRYFGPVVLITDALTYSAGDIFAAGFQDHGIGPIVGAHRRTGAGGANRWTYDKLIGLGLSDDPYAELPHGAAFNVAMRRSLRVGRNKGVLVEDAGVRANEVHPMTRRDVLHDNIDLIAKAASMLRPRRRRP